jgi:hypothetical protein
MHYSTRRTCSKKLSSSKTLFNSLIKRNLFLLSRVYLTHTHEIHERVNLEKSRLLCLGGAAPSFERTGRFGHSLFSCAAVAMMPELADLIEERDKFWKEYCRLNREISDHPDTKLQRERERRKNLERFLPEALHPILLDHHHPRYGRLLEIHIDLEDEGAQGKPELEWVFKAIFSKLEWSTTVDIDNDLNAEKPSEFESVDYHSDPVQLWYVAKNENDDNVACALAAFVFAACEHQSEWDASPSRAFTTVTGKTEMK